MEEGNIVSDCCNAPIKWGDICTKCGEHCDEVDLDEEPSDDPNAWSGGFADNH